MKKTIGYVLSHTHWDREWYLSFQLFRMRLVDMLDTLIPYLEQHPEFPHFHLDGQTVCLEDYLEVRPDQAERLRHLIEAGRIAVGPWYVLPDLQCIGQSLFCAISAAALRWRSALASARRLDICRISFLIRRSCRRSSPGMASARL